MIAALTLGWLLNILFSFWYTSGQSRSSVGLPLAFVLSTTFLYIGFIVYLNPNYSHIRLDGSLYLLSYNFTYETAVLGALASLVGVTSFNVGTFLSRFRTKRLKRPVGLEHLHFSRSFRSKLLVGLALFGVAGFSLARLQLPIPLIDAILQVGRNAALIAVCIGAAFTVLTDRKASYRRWLLIGMVIPAIYLIVFGFASYGFILVCILVAFYLAFMRRKTPKLWKALTAGFAITYIFLAAFVAWMNFRDNLRAMIADNSSIGARIEVLWQAALSSRLLSWYDYQSLDLLTVRLNQYIFVGKAIELQSADPSLRLYGETIWIAFFAWVPRFLWPEKPEMNTTQFMRDHTGIDFGDRATFGNGPVLEYYVNFGWPGIILGLLLLGVLLGRIDTKARQHLDAGQMLGFAKWFAVGMAFVAPLTNLFFMINTAVASFAIFSAIQYFMGTGRVRLGNHAQRPPSQCSPQPDAAPLSSLRM
ncbi:hypothetical protein [Marinobacter alexandrii]|uniref:hypothetical protein n=1 Tax=Marinobacter alexandrii TaxID=2570351 RepID=UPI0032989AF4